MTTPWKRWGFRLAPVLGFAIVGVVGAELVGRLLFTDTPYVPGPQIEKVQSLLVLHPEVGFLWKPHVTPAEGVTIAWSDSEPYLLSTDSWGFLNAPEAVARVSGGEAPDVVALGDSFLQIAAYSFQERLQEDGLFYYSLAMHRHGPPQYNRILEGYGVKLRPRWVLYGISENDFADTIDFERWRESGRDWFSFHSGSWCGPPPSGSPARDRLRRALPGAWALWRVLRARFRPDPFRRASPERIHEYVLEAREVAEAAGARFVVLLIPEKRTAIHGSTMDAARHEMLAGLLRESRVEVVDLRTSFASTTNPEALFYRRDSHWNRDGQALAAERILDFIHGRERRRSRESVE